MLFLTPFMFGLISTLVVGAVARIVVDLFSSSYRTAPVAGVSAAAGYALSSFSYRGPADTGALLALAAALGSLVALALLWYVLIKRPTRQSGGLDD